MPKRQQGSSIGRLKRIVQLLSILDSPKPHSAAQLAQAIGVSKRTVYRDLAALEQCGVPALFDDAVHGYTLPWPVTNRLNTEELLCLLIAVHAIQIRAAPKFGRLLRKAATKLAKLLPDSDRGALKQLTRVFGRPLRETPRRQEDHLLTVLRAIEQKNQCRLSMKANCRERNRTNCTCWRFGRPMYIGNSSGSSKARSTTVPSR